MSAQDSINELIGLHAKARFSDMERRARQVLEAASGSVAAVVGPPACGLPESAFVFCSFNQIIKLSAQVFDLWLALLRAVDHSVLWLLRPDEAAVEALPQQAQSPASIPGASFSRPWSA